MLKSFAFQLEQHQLSTDMILQGLHGCKHTLPAGITLDGLSVIPTSMKSHREGRRRATNLKGYSYTCLIGHYSHYTLHCCQTAISLPSLLSLKMLWQKISLNGKRRRSSRAKLLESKFLKGVLWNEILE